jgi:hypothetical protein
MKPADATDPKTKKLPKNSPKKSARNLLLFYPTTNISR